jgi:hypothetical protein
MDGFARICAYSELTVNIRGSAVLGLVGVNVHESQAFACLLILHHTL